MTTIKLGLHIAKGKRQRTIGWVNHARIYIRTYNYTKLETYGLQGVGGVQRHAVADVVEVVTVITCVGEVPEAFGAGFRRLSPIGCVHGASDAETEVQQRPDDNEDDFLSTTEQMNISKLLKTL